MVSANSSAPGDEVLREGRLQVGAALLAKIPGDFQPSVVLPDGGLLGTTKSPDPEIGCMGDVVLVDASGNSTAVTQQTPERIGQCTETGDADESYVVWWSEQGSTDLYNVPWVLRSLDRKTGKVVDIAQFTADDSGAPVPTPFMFPHLSNGKVVYAAGYGPAAAVWIVPADGSSAPQIVEDDSGDAQFVWPYVYALKRVGESAFGLVRVDVRDGTRLEMSLSVSSTYAFNGSSLFIAHSDGGADIVDVSGRVQAQIEGLTSPAQYAVGIEDGFVFYNEQASYMYHLPSRTLVNLGGRPLANYVIGDGHFVYWTDAATEQGRTDSVALAEPTQRLATVDDILARLA